MPSADLHRLAIIDLAVGPQSFVSSIRDVLRLSAASGTFRYFYSEVLLDRPVHYVSRDLRDPVPRLRNGLHVPIDDRTVAVNILWRQHGAALIVDPFHAAALHLPTVREGGGTSRSTTR